jgi:glutaredoxin-like protein
MKLLTEKNRTEISLLIGDLKNKVKILAFYSDASCPTCQDTIQYIEEICELNDNINVMKYEKTVHSEIFLKYKISLVPAILISNIESDNSRFRFYGIPSGYEIHSFVHVIRMVSGTANKIEPEIIERIKKLNKSFHLEVFITPTCSFCPQAVINGHILSYYNEYITCNMIESISMKEYVKQYNISSVPVTLINGIIKINGSKSLNETLNILENI